MALNGKGGPFIKFDPNPMSSNHDHDHDHDFVIQNNNNNNDNSKGGISIAERRAAKCGFNVPPFGISRPPPYFTVPPGISPSALLDSPIMLPNAQAQLSPTTGTFSLPSPNHESLNIKLKLAATQSKPHSGIPNKDFGELEFQKESQEISRKVCSADDNAIVSHVGSTNPVLSTSVAATNQTVDDPRNAKEINTRPNPDHNKIQKGWGASNIPKEAAKYSDDGYYWRKYGQKHVKGSEYPRSYFKCTNTSCMVKKTVERSHDGQIAEIEYKGSHNHPKPSSIDLQHHQTASTTGAGLMSLKTEGGKDFVAFDASERTPSTSFLSDFSDPTSRSLEPDHEANQEFSSTFGGVQDCDALDRDHEASQGSMSINDEDDDNGECEPKKRKKESFPSHETTAMSRSTREPRVVVQIESEIDILDDGYRWRKYGQKVVKGNPNPRSYYKCTTPACPVRKHVERAATDIKCVVTTYEGKHNHEISTTKNGLGGTSDHLPVVSTRSPSADHHQMPKLVVGKQTPPQDHLPLYMERKPILNYNELMMRPAGNPSTTTHDLNFATSSIYPLSFPPLIPSMPYRSSFFVSSNHMKPTAYPSTSNLNYHPMLPDYMTLPSPINHHHLPSGPGNNGTSLVGNNNYNLINSYATVQTPTNQAAGGNNNNNSNSNSIKKVLKPKEEHKDDVELYDACQSIQNHHHHHHLHQGN